MEQMTFAAGTAGPFPAAGRRREGASAAPFRSPRGLSAGPSPGFALNGAHERVHQGFCISGYKTPRLEA